jgi:hypothetical protein
VSDILATSAGLELVKAFMCIQDRKLRRAIVELVEEIGNRLSFYWVGPFTAFAGITK